MVLVLLLAIIRFRTNSTHAIFRQLWRLIAGKANGDNTSFNKFMEAQDNLSQFRFISGKARTTAQMHSLIGWSTRHAEDISGMKACGPYFDREQPGLKPATQRPNELQLLGTSMAWSASLVLLLASAALAWVPAVLVTVKASNKVLLVDMQLTRSVSDPGAERLSRKQCEQPSENNAVSSGFNQQDAAVICGFYADPKLHQFISDYLIVQRWTFGLLAAVLLSGLWFLSRRLSQGKAALAMAARLDRPRP